MMRAWLAVGLLTLVVGCRMSSKQEPSVVSVGLGSSSEVEDFKELTDGWHRVSPSALGPCAPPSAHGEGSSEFRVFVNQVASRAFGTAFYPAGAIIMKDSRNGAVATMKKLGPGFAPLEGDWEYQYNGERMPPSACSNCHRKAAKTDHIYGTWFSRRRAGGESD